MTRCISCDRTITPTANLNDQCVWFALGSAKPPIHRVPTQHKQITRCIDCNGAIFLNYAPDPNAELLCAKCDNEFSNIEMQ